MPGGELGEGLEMRGEDDGVAGEGGKGAEGGDGGEGAEEGKGGEGGEMGEMGEMGDFLIFMPGQEEVFFSSNFFCGIYPACDLLSARDIPRLLPANVFCCRSERAL